MPPPITPITVTTLTDENDAGATVAVPGGTGLSLREAIALANATAGDDTIVFGASLGAGGPIRLTHADGTLQVTQALTIDGDIDDDGVADILITGDKNGDDTTVGTTDLTNIFTTPATELDDNVRIFDATANLTLDGLRLTGGVATGLNAAGGAVRSTHTVTVTNSTVNGNSALSRGGGILANTVNVTDSTVSGNSAGELGGGISANISATITNSTLSGNSAGVDAGALGGTTVTLTNSTVSGNTAALGDGGGVRAETANLINSTVSGNSAGAKGGGIFATITATLTNSIVLGNDAGTTGDEVAFFTGGTINHAGRNIVGVGGDINGSDGVINAASVGAVFAAVDGTTGGGQLADNGGPVQTVALNANAANPAIDGGDDTLDAATDARGLGRVDFQGVAPNGSNISDLGAFEAQAETPSLVVTTLDDTVNDLDGLTSLREAIAFVNGNSGADTITFDPSLAGGTIRLTHADGALQVSGELTIDGDIDDDGAADILITGDVDGDDITPVGDITDVAASQTAGKLGDNVRIFDATASLTLEGLVLTGGVSPTAGGAVTSTAALTLTNSVVSGNRALGPGGGLHTDGTITLMGSTVSDNSAGSAAGGVRANTAILNNSTVSGNSASVAGGGLAVTGTATLTNSTVSGNSASSDGGGIAASSAHLTNSTVSGNSAGGDGGGIIVTSATTITNSTISGNTAGDEGGGFFNGAGNSEITNSLIVGNNAVSSGGQIQNTVGGNLDIFHSNIAGGNAAEQIFAATVDIGGGVLAGVLADNGGPVQTIALKRDLTNPALDAGDDGQAPDLDARGFSRTDFAGVANNVANISDLGAFELQNAAPTATNLTHTEFYAEDAVSLDLVDILVSDADVGDMITARLTLANPAAGALTTSGAATYNAGSGVWTITGLVAQVNAALAAVAFKPAANFDLDTTIATRIVDAQGDGPADGTITLDVTPVNDAPAITSNGGGATVAVLVGENLKPVAIVAATDPDDAPTYAIAGGADAALFAIDPATGALVFKDAPDFEASGDTDHDNVYEVTVVATDGVGTDTQAILVTVGDADGATITGTKGKDKVNATETVSGEPLPTGEEDQIDGKGGKDKLSGLDGDDTIAGGGGRDVLNGDAGDDTLAGGGGRDKYIGGSGIDSYVFDAHVTPTGLFDHLSFAAVKRRADVIVDYEKDEKIILDSDVFKGLVKGSLGADQFHVGEKAEAFTHRIIYDESAGLLVFDRNGSAVAGDAVIARIGKHLDHLDHNDFVVI